MQRNFILCLLVPAGSALITTTGFSQAVYTTSSSFQSQVTTNRLFNFEGIAPTNLYVRNPNLSPLTVTVTGGTDLNVYDVPGAYSNGRFTIDGSADMAAGLANGTQPTATIRFGSAVTAFGADIGFRDYGDTGPVFDSTVITLFYGTHQVGTAYTTGSLKTGFVGFTTTTPFDSITFTPRPSTTPFRCLIT